MEKVVSSGAILKCSQGNETSCLQVSSQDVASLQGKFIATVKDNALTNIANFRLCSSMQNPDVAKATAAAKSSTPVPQPCVPSITGDWMPGSSVMHIQQQHVLTMDSQLKCAYDGTISINKTDSSIMKVR